MVNVQFWICLVSTFFQFQHHFVALQGGLDLQYLSARYSRGKQAVADIMEKRHCFVQHRSISLAHGDVVEKQVALGPSTFLG